MSNYILNEIKIEVTYNCLLSCVHCSSNANPENQLSMSLQKCIQIIDEAANMDVKEIAFSGGEPLIWDGIKEVVAYTKSKKIITSIYTTGNCNNFSKVTKSIKTAGVDKLVFSLFSNLEKEHDRVTRKLKSFTNTMEAIKFANLCDINTEVHFVALASNYQRLADVAIMAQKNGVKRISVLRFVPQGRGVLISNYDTLNKSQNLELKKIITELREKGFDIRTGSPFNVLLLNKTPKCMAAQDRLIVSPDLNIYPCDAFKQIPNIDFFPNDEFSNLEKHTVSECWEESKYLSLVRNTILGTPTEPCYSCKQYKLCVSGCLAQKYLHYSSLNMNPDPACLLGGLKV